MDDEKEKCTVCGCDAVWETCVSGVYLCDDDYCLITSAKDNYVEGEL